MDHKIKMETKQEHTEVGWGLRGKDWWNGRGVRDSDQDKCDKNEAYTLCYCQKLFFNCLGMVMNSCNLSTGEVEKRGSQGLHYS